ncbi:chemotaxis protein methyltransferase CheR [Desulfocucumis palustris]|uniref:protein-glutamate O-methyltransferase n=1 Tax=Desulfocucumis palustris TaxID=1898651 RepID=A0A2L2XE44_9FIRM|nr:protein-glutamate O-methyltransferase CheR [Desulfocucumis palustris]GBF32101.1 chemotaxis protein methyltransferase CheR [Desulfocucumis palustris]
MGITLSHNEFLLMQKYINELCGFFISEDKSYLIESRLSKILLESGARSFLDLYAMLAGNKNTPLADRVVDAITTHETQWFRDKTIWRIFKDILLPEYTSEILGGGRTTVKIWSAACSTGQEPYSIAMCIDAHLKKNGLSAIKDSFRILATDVSPSVLRLAETGRYDGIAMVRGLDDGQKKDYFRENAGSWNINPDLKGLIEFRRFNLTESFLPLGRFDVIFCRYVTIYFNEQLKKKVLANMASLLNDRGVLFLGNSEIFPGCEERFIPERYGEGVYYRLKGV